MSCYEMESEPLDEIFGFHMDYPTADEVHRFKREVSWEERFEVLSQGFHRGCYVDYCYTLQSLTDFVTKRNPRNPTGGVRTLDGEKLTAWVNDIIGDHELAAVLERVFSGNERMPVIVDTVRVVLSARMNQYAEVLEEEG